MVKVIPHNNISYFTKALSSAVSRRSVAVGIPGDKTYPNGKRVSDVAMLQEFGNGKTLPRPFVRNAIAEKKDEWKDKAKEVVREAIVGKTDVKAGMEELGNKVKSDVVASLDSLLAPPLKPSTVAAKKRKHRQKPEKPLVDTGLLRDAFEVKVTV